MNIHEKTFHNNYLNNITKIKTCEDRRRIVVALCFRRFKKNVLTKHENFVSIFTKNNGSFKVQTNNVQSTTLLQKKSITDGQNRHYTLYRRNYNRPKSVSIFLSIIDCNGFPTATRRIRFNTEFFLNIHLYFKTNKYRSKKVF